MVSDEMFENVGVFFSIAISFSRLLENYSKQFLYSGQEMATFLPSNKLILS